MRVLKCGAQALLVAAVGVLLGGCGSASNEPSASNDPVGTVGEALTGGNFANFYSAFLPDNRGRDHFYSADLNEINNAAANGWAYEMVRFSVVQSVNGQTPTAPLPGGQPVNAVPLLRYWGGGASDHFYTTDPGEGGATLNHGYVVDQPASWNVWVFTQQVQGSCPVYRAYSGGGTIDHFYTMSYNEYLNATTPNSTCTFPCVGTDYTGEGVRFYAFPYNSSTCPS